MMMDPTWLKRVLIALVIANVLAFGWWRGWFDGMSRNTREPQRLEHQVDPDRIKLMPYPVN